MKNSRITAPLLLALDMAALLVVFNLVSLVRFLIPQVVRAHERGAGNWEALVGTVARLGEAVPYANAIITWPLLVPLGLMIVAFYLIDGYRARTDMMSLDYTSQHIIAVLAAMAATLLLIFVLIKASFPLQSSRSVVVVSFLLLAPVTLGYRRLHHQRLLRTRGQRSLVFVGDDASSRAFEAECQRQGTTQPLVFTAADWEPTPGAGSATLDLRPFRDVLEDIRRGRLEVEAIVLREANRELSPEVSEQLMALYFNGIPTYTLELFHQVYWRKIPLYRLNQTWLFQEGFPIAREPVFERLKRMSDIVLSGLGLLIALPFLAIAVVAIKLDDGGPVFYRQPRIGRNRVPFRIAKLRTMRADAGNGDRYTRPGDSRITRAGRFLRATRMDEMPQLWNVLRGEMSLIGPRAEWDRLATDYERAIPCYHFRHLVRPGVTGWAQVNYPYGADLDDTRRKLEYDLYYIRHFSFRLDAAIVLKTVHIMLFGKGR